MLLTESVTGNTNNILRVGQVLSTEPEAVNLNSNISSGKQDGEGGSNQAGNNSQEKEEPLLTHQAI